MKTEQGRAYKFGKVFFRGPKAAPTLLRWDDKKKLYMKDDEGWGVSFVREGKKLMTVDSSDKKLGGYQIFLAIRTDWEYENRNWLASKMKDADELKSLASPKKAVDTSFHFRVGDSVVIKDHNEKWDGSVVKIESIHNGKEVEADCEGTKYMFPISSIGEVVDETEPTLS